MKIIAYAIFLIYFVIYGINVSAEEIDDKSIISYDEYIAQGNVVYRAEVSWNFGYTDISYVGLGRDRDEAFQSAKQNCIQSNILDDRKNYCQNTPRGTNFSCSVDNTTARTGCIGWGKGVPNPCPSGQERGDELPQDIRLGCTFHNFVCVGRKIECP